MKIQISISKFLVETIPFAHCLREELRVSLPIAPKGEVCRGFTENEKNKFQLKNEI